MHHLTAAEKEGFLLVQKYAKPEAIGHYVRPTDQSQFEEAYKLANASVEGRPLDVNRDENLLSLSLQLIKKPKNIDLKTFDESEQLEILRLRTLQGELNNKRIQSTNQLLELASYVFGPASLMQRDLDSSYKIGPELIDQCTGNLKELLRDKKIAISEEGLRHIIALGGIPGEKEKMIAVEVKKFQEYSNLLTHSLAKSIEVFTAQKMDKKQSPLSRFDQDILKNTTTTMKELGDCGLNISQMALMMNIGHQRTWQHIGIISGTLIGTADKVNKTFSTGASFLTLSSLASGLGLITGLVSMGTALFGKKKTAGDPNQAVLAAIQQSHLSIMNAIQESHNILMAALMKGFQGLGNIITQNMVVVFNRLDELNRKGDRLEVIMTKSTKELYDKDLITALVGIKNHLLHDQQLSKKAEYLQLLSAWMEKHTKTKVQTALLRDTQNASESLNILSDKDFDSIAMFPFLISQVKRLMPQNPFLKGINIHELPNVKLLAFLSEIYSQVVVKFKLKGNYIPTLTSAIDELIKIQSLVIQIKFDNDIWDVLFRQYYDLRYRIGHAIYKCRKTFTDKDSLSATLGSLLRPSIETDNLMNLLNELELRRWLLIRLHQLAGNNPDVPMLLDKIEALESKELILRRKREYYEKAAADIIEHAHLGQFIELQRSIENGADINQWDSWGQPIHYISMYFLGEVKQWSPENASQLFHVALKYNPKPQHTNGSRRCRNDTWGKDVRPVTMILNNCYFHMALLYCANGFEIRETQSEFMNGYHSANRNLWSAIVQKYLVKDINTENGVLNRKALIEAYEYYKAVEAGHPISPNNINQDCLLWLVCVLGDLKPIKLLENFNADVNKAIPIANFTPLMMAVFCNKENVVDFLLSKGARLDAKLTTVEPNPGSIGGDTRTTGIDLRFADAIDEHSHLLSLAIKREYWNLADKLVKAGITPNVKQAEQISKGLSSLVILKDTRDIKEKADTLASIQPSEIIYIAKNAIEQLNIAKISLELQKQMLLKEIEEKKNTFFTKLTTILKNCKKYHAYFIKLYSEKGEVLSEVKEGIDNLSQTIDRLDKNLSTKEIAITIHLVGLVKAIVSSFNLINSELTIALSDYKLSDSINQWIKELNTDLEFFVSTEKSISPFKVSNEGSSYPLNVLFDYPSKSNSTSTSNSNFVTTAVVPPAPLIKNNG